MKADSPEFRAFVQGYLTCALWSSIDHCEEGSGNCLDASFCVDDIDPASKAEHEAECLDFCTEHERTLRVLQRGAAYEWSTAGHDFWLTRNHHGAGFWDRGLGKRGDKLTEAAHAAGSRDPYVGDDGKVYLS